MILSETDDPLDTGKTHDSNSGRSGNVAIVLYVASASHCCWLICQQRFGKDGGWWFVAHHHG